MAFVSSMSVGCVCVVVCVWGVCVCVFVIVHMNVGCVSWGVEGEKRVRASTINTQRVHYWRCASPRHHATATAAASQSPQLITLTLPSIPLPLRPDVATWLGDDLLRHLFSKDTPLSPDLLDVMASLLMLPEGWEQLLSGESPRMWLNGYAKAVMQVGVEEGKRGRVCGGRGRPDFVRGCKR